MRTKLALLFLVILFGAPAVITHRYFGPEARQRSSLAEYQNYLARQKGEEFTVTKGQALPLKTRETVRYIGVRQNPFTWFFRFQIELNGVATACLVYLRDSIDNRPYGDINLQKECDVPVILHVTKINDLEITYHLEMVSDYREKVSMSLK